MHPHRPHPHFQPLLLGHARHSSASPPSQGHTASSHNPIDLSTITPLSLRLEHCVPSLDGFSLSVMCEVVAPRGQPPERGLLDPRAWVGRSTCPARDAARAVVRVQELQAR